MYHVWEKEQNGNKVLVEKLDGKRPTGTQIYTYIYIYKTKQNKQTNKQTNKLCGP
jgi:hypothetical protein